VGRESLGVGRVVSSLTVIELTGRKYAEQWCSADIGIMNFRAMDRGTQRILWLMLEGDKPDAEIMLTLVAARSPGAAFASRSQNLSRELSM